jgi:hypothetical protein
MSGAGSTPSRSETAAGAAAHNSSFRPPVIFFRGWALIIGANVAEGSHPPGQTAGPSHGQSVRGFVIAFTRNTSPVGFTFSSVTTPVQLNTQKPCALATEDALPLTGHPPQAGTQLDSHSGCRTQSAPVEVRSRLGQEPEVTARM